MAKMNIFTFIGFLSLQILSMRAMEIAQDSRMSQKKRNKMLNLAVRSDTLEKAQAAINLDANVKAKDTFGETPLHWAAYRRRPEFIKLLIAAGAKLHAKNKAGLTPLDIAQSGQLPNHGILYMYTDFKSTVVLRAFVTSVSQKDVAKSKDGAFTDIVKAQLALAQKYLPEENMDGLKAEILDNCAALARAAAVKK